MCFDMFNYLSKHTARLAKLDDSLGELTKKYIEHTQMFEAVKTRLPVHFH